MQKKDVKTTFYGYPDNDDGDNHYGTNVIAHALQLHGRGRHANEHGNPIAGGTGTFQDPVTAAARMDSRLLPPSTLVYIPGLKKYFFLEDECGNCDLDEWIDLWMESNDGNDATAVQHCEYEWTGDDSEPREIWIDPPDGLEIDPRPFFDIEANRCRPPTR